MRDVFLIVSDFWTVIDVCQGAIGVIMAIHGHNDIAPPDTLFCSGFFALVIAVLRPLSLSLRDKESLSSMTLRLWQPYSGCGYQRLLTTVFESPWFAAYVIFVTCRLLNKDGWLSERRVRPTRHQSKHQISKENFMFHRITTHHLHLTLLALLTAIFLLINPISVNAARNFDTIYIVNKCYKPIRVLVRYKDLDGDWVTRGWFNLPTFKEYERRRIVGREKVGKTRNNRFYYYAESKDGKTKWSGNYKRKFYGKTYRFRRMKITSKNWGDWTKRFTCK